MLLLTIDGGITFGLSTEKESDGKEIVLNSDRFGVTVANQRFHQAL